jgi:hypothetical protein
MKCHKCGKRMKHARGMKFNEYLIDGWKCPCGEAYYEPEQAQRVLMLNRLKRAAIKAKLGRIRSNLIIRLPKDVENALGLEQGKDVLIKVEKDGFRVSV